REQVDSRFFHTSRDEHPAAFDLFHCDRDVWILEEARRRCRELLFELQRGETLRFHVVHEWERDLAIWPNHDVCRQILLAPECDRQNVVQADHVIGRQSDCRRGGGTESFLKRTTLLTEDPSACDD